MAALFPGDGLSLPHLIGGEGALWQARVAKADLNFDDAASGTKRNLMNDGVCGDASDNATRPLPSVRFDR
jgi:hypothetical protein